MISADVDEDICDPNLTNLSKFLDVEGNSDSYLPESFENGKGRGVAVRFQFPDPRDKISSPMNRKRLTSCELIRWFYWFHDLTYAVRHNAGFLRSIWLT
jgi:hypothetical protein